MKGYGNPFEPGHVVDVLSMSIFYPRGPQGVELMVCWAGYGCKRLANDPIATQICRCWRVEVSQQAGVASTLKTCFKTTKSTNV